MLTKQEYEELSRWYLSDKKSQVSLALKKKLSTPIQQQLATATKQQKTELFLYIIYCDACEQKQKDSNKLNDYFSMLTLVLLNAKPIIKNDKMELPPELKYGLDRIKSLLTQPAITLTITDDKRTLADSTEPFQPIFAEDAGYLVSDFVAKPTGTVSDKEEKHEKRIISDAVSYQAIVGKEPGSMIAIISLNTQTEDEKSAQQLLEKVLAINGRYETIKTFELGLANAIRVLKESDIGKKIFATGASLTAVRTHILPNGIHIAGICIGEPMLFAINNDTNAIQPIVPTGKTDVFARVFEIITCDIPPNHNFIVGSGEAQILLQNPEFKKKFAFPLGTKLPLTQLVTKIKDDMLAAASILVATQTKAAPATKAATVNTTIGVFSEQWFSSIFNPSLEDEEFTDAPRFRKATSANAQTTPANNKKPPTTPIYTEVKEETLDVDEIKTDVHRVLLTSNELSEELAGKLYKFASSEKKIREQLLGFFQNILTHKQFFILTVAMLQAHIRTSTDDPLSTGNLATELYAKCAEKLEFKPFENADLSTLPMDFLHKIISDYHLAKDPSNPQLAAQNAANAIIAKLRPSLASELIAPTLEDAFKITRASADQETVSAIINNIVKSQIDLQTVLSIFDFEKDKPQKVADRENKLTLSSPSSTRISTYKIPTPKVEDEKPKSDKYAVSIPITAIEKSTSSITSGITLDAARPFVELKSKELKPEIANLSSIQTGSTYFSNNPEAKNENNSGNYLRVEYIDGLPCPQIIDFGRNTFDAPISKFDFQFRQQIPDLVRVAHAQLSGVKYDSNKVTLVIKRLLFQIHELITKTKSPAFAMMQGITFIDDKGIKHMVGFGIGDIMLVIEKKKTDDEKPQLTTICPARNIYTLAAEQKPDNIIQNLENGATVLPTAQPRSQFPAHDWEARTIIFDTITETGDTLHALTNGMWSFLPVKVTAQTVSSDFYVLETQLDSTCQLDITKTALAKRTTQISVTTKIKKTDQQEYKALQDEYDKKQVILKELKTALETRIACLKQDKEIKLEDDLDENLAKFYSFMYEKNVFANPEGQIFKKDIDRLEEEIRFVERCKFLFKDDADELLLPQKNDLDEFERMLHIAKNASMFSPPPINSTKNVTQPTSQLTVSTGQDTHQASSSAPSPFPSYKTWLAEKEAKDSDNDNAELDDTTEELVQFYQHHTKDSFDRRHPSFARFSHEDPLALKDTEKQKKADIMAYQFRLNQIAAYENALDHTQKQAEAKQFFEFGNNADHLQMTVPDETQRKELIEQAVLQRLKLTVMEANNELLKNLEHNKKLLTFFTFQQEMQKCVTLLNAEQLLANYLSEINEKTHETMIIHLKKNQYSLDFYGLDKSQQNDVFKAQLLKQIGITPPLLPTVLTQADAGSITPTSPRTAGASMSNLMMANNAVVVRGIIDAAAAVNAGIAAARADTAPANAARPGRPTLPLPALPS